MDTEVNQPEVVSPVRRRSRVQQQDSGKSDDQSRFEESFSDWTVVDRNQRKEE